MGKSGACRYYWAIWRKGTSCCGVTSRKSALLSLRSSNSASCKTPPFDIINIRKLSICRNNSKVKAKYTLELMRHNTYQLPRCLKIHAFNQSPLSALFHTASQPFAGMISAISSPLTLKPSDSAQPETKIPRLVYGTAWKRERTSDLVYQALRAGFRGVDTAAQLKHYREDLVGEAIRKYLAEGAIKREDLYVRRGLSRHRQSI